MGAKRPAPTYLVILMDVLLIGGALLVFAYFHHVRPQNLGEGTQSTVTWEHTPGMEQPEADAPVGADEGVPTEGDGPTGEDSAPVAQTVAIGDFSATFPTGELVTNDDTVASYADENVRVLVTQYTGEELAYYVADIWVRDVRYLQTAFATGSFQRGSANYKMPAVVAADNNAVIAITGDFCSARSSGVVIRNGLLYRDSVSSEDICILYADGVMETYYATEFNLEDAVARGAYQSWSFGPKLIDNGAVPQQFNASDAVIAKNPRSAIGYYEPGHYCFVTVDGRQSGYSKGLSMSGLSQLFLNLGCVAAYNLDGGQTAAMATAGGLVNKPYKNGREVGDILFISPSPLS